MEHKDFTKNIFNNINYIYCDDKGKFNSYGLNNDLCALYAFITFNLLRSDIDIKSLLKAMCNAFDLYKDLK